MSTPNKIHDLFFKQSMSDLRVAKDFFSMHLPASIKDQVDLETLQLEKTNFVTPRNFVKNQQGEKVVDMLYSALIAGELGYFYVLAEHQSTVDKDMPLRVMRYILEVIAYHLDKRKKYKDSADTKYPIVVPLIFYNGRTPYNLTTSFLGMYPRQHMVLAEKILTSPFQLVDLNKIDDEEERGHVWGRIMQVAMKANLNQYRHDLEELAKLLVGLVKSVELEMGGYDFIEDAICYTSDVADIRDDDPRGYLEIIAKELSEQNKGKIMTLAERFENAARKEGREEGVEQGIEQEKKEVVLKMLKAKSDLKFISEVTELPVKEIEELQAKNQEEY